MTNIFTDASVGGTWNKSISNGITTYTLDSSFTINNNNYVELTSNIVIDGGGNTITINVSDPDYEGLFTIDNGLISLNEAPIIKNINIIITGTIKLYGASLIRQNSKHFYLYNCAIISGTINKYGSG